MAVNSYQGRFTTLRNAKRRKQSSKTWLIRQINDPYVAKSKVEGYRSRSAYKLIEINEKFKILKSGMNVIDLGAAPGGWSQVIAKIINSDKENAKNKLIAIDIQPMESIAGVIILQKNIFADDIKTLIKTKLNNKFADVVLSDMAANTTGHNATDHFKIINLCENAFQLSMSILKPKGHFIAKVFKGGIENDLLTRLKDNFTLVKHFKPNASYKSSSEFYLIALKKK